MEQGRRRALCIAAAILVLLLAPAFARADRAVLAALHGQHAGRHHHRRPTTMLSCVTAESVCAGVPRAGTLRDLTEANNNAQRDDVRRLRRRPAPPSTPARPRSTLPAGARVLFAGLYYGGRTTRGTGGADGAEPGRARHRAARRRRATRTTARSPARRSTPRETPIRASTTSPRSSRPPARAITAWQMCRRGTGRSDGQLAGWSLAVAYGDPAAPSRNLSDLRRPAERVLEQPGRDDPAHRLRDPCDRTR